MRSVDRILVLLVLLALCTVPQVNAEDGHLRYAGATTLQRFFMPDLARTFYNETAVRIQIDGGNTNPGLHALLNGEVDLAGAGRYLTEAEKQQGLVEHFLGWDILSILVHNSNPVKTLTMDQLQGIFSGRIDNWKEVGGNDQSIVVISCPKGSGMRAAVQKLILKDQPFTRREIIAAIVAKADQQVGMFPMSITALSQSMVDAASVKTIDVDGMVPSAANIAAGKYLLAKPLTLVTRGTPDGNLGRLIELALSDRGRAILGKSFIAAEQLKP